MNGAWPASQDWVRNRLLLGLSGSTPANASWPPSPGPRPQSDHTAVAQWPLRMRGGYGYKERRLCGRHTTSKGMAHADSDGKSRQRAEEEVRLTHPRSGAFPMRHQACSQPGTFHTTLSAVLLKTRTSSVTSCVVAL